jgi:NADPH-dependent 2,4-dienoyl-CoA reductase/sulfur reductase-like enzyme
MGEVPARTEVLVVGAEPVGLAVAASLAGHGHDVTVVDRQAAAANTSRRRCRARPDPRDARSARRAKRLAGLGIQARPPPAVRPLRNVALRLLALLPAFRRGLAE